MSRIIKMEALSRQLQKKITDQAEYNAALDYFCDSDIPVDDQNAALKAVVKVNPDLAANEVCSPVEDYDAHTVAGLLKEIELTKYGYIRHTLWAMNLVKG